MDKFLEEWMPRIFRFALRLTSDLHKAEDLAQETMLRAWRQRKSLRDFQSSRVWLFRIATNLWAVSCVADARRWLGLGLCPKRPGKSAKLPNRPWQGEKSFTSLWQRSSNCLRGSARCST